MSAPTRSELEEFWDAWLAANRDAERLGDWKNLAEFYALDATYGWMYSPDEHFMAVGRDQIRDWAIGLEMTGLDGWHYDYQATVIDEKSAMIVGFWKQRSGITDDETGGEYEVLSIGGSWFGVARQADGPDQDQLKICWQRDWFDLGSVADHLFADIWNREGLADRDRRLLLIGLLAADGGHDALKIQIPAALESGDLDARALREIVVFMSHYAGWPSGARMNSIAEAAIDKASQAGNASSS